MSQESDPMMSDDDDYSMSLGNDDTEVVNQFFWSLVVQPGKQYSQHLPYNLHINHVSLDESAQNGSKSTLFCETEDGVSHPICFLRAGQTDQLSLNLFFPSEETLKLRSSPNSAPIHLLGYCEEIESQLDEDDEDDEDDEEEEEEVTNEKEKEKKQPQQPQQQQQQQQQPKAQEKKRKNETPSPSSSSAAVQEIPTKKAKVEANNNNNNNNKVTPPKTPDSSKSTQGNESKKQPQTPKNTPSSNEAKRVDTPKPPPEKKEEPLGVQKKLSMGVVYVVNQLGKGPQATAGKKVNVQYRGWLEKNGKEFDKGKIGFRLGLGEVIKGWDIGVEGMHIGEKRTLTIPASAGYGKKGAPPSIPPNSTLKFEVTLLNVQ